MKKYNLNLIVRRSISYLSLLAIILYVVTGYGMTRTAFMEKISFGILTRALSFKIHSLLIFPLIIFLVLHLYFSCNWLKRVIRK